MIAPNNPDGCPEVGYERGVPDLRVKDTTG